MKKRFNADLDTVIVLSHIPKQINYGTSEGALAGWDTRGRGQKIEINADKNIKSSSIQNVKKSIDKLTNELPEISNYIKGIEIKEDIIGSEGKSISGQAVKSSSVVKTRPGSGTDTLYHEIAHIVYWNNSKIQELSNSLKVGKTEYAKKFIGSNKAPNEQFAEAFGKIFQKPPDKRTEAESKFVNDVKNAIKFPNKSVSSTSQSFPRKSYVHPAYRK